VELLSKIIQWLISVPALWLAQRRARYLGIHARTLRGQFEELKRQRAGASMIFAHRVRDAEMRHRIALRSLDGYNKGHILSTITDHDRQVMASILGLIAVLILTAALCTVFVEYNDERPKKDDQARTDRLQEDLGALRGRVAETCPVSPGTDVRVPAAEPTDDHAGNKRGEQGSERSAPDTE
jgi:hypothetical protein